MATVSMLCLSTAHVTRADDERLTRLSGAASDDNPLYYVLAYDGGFILRVPSDDDGLMGEACRALVRSWDFGASFTRLLRHARRTGHDWIRLDRDADRVAGLPSFDW